MNIIGPKWAPLQRVFLPVFQILIEATMLKLSVVTGALIAVPVSSICHILALSGGGTKGAYEMGVLSGLVDNLPAEDVKWSVVSGISAGAINTIGISTFAIGDEKNMTDSLLPVWADITSDQLYQIWTDDKPHSGYYDTSPLRDTIEGLVGSPPALADRKIVIVGATSLNTGNLVTWTEADKDVLVDATMCSSAIPGVFPTQSIPGVDDTFSDGGDIIGVNIFGGISRCRETESDDANIIVDIVTTYGATFATVDASGYDSKDVMMRKHELSTFLKSNGAVEDAQVAYPDVTWRYDIQPSATLPGNGLDFRKEDLSFMISLGRKDAVDAIKTGFQKKRGGQDKKKKRGGGARRRTATV